MPILLPGGKKEAPVVYNHPNELLVQIIVKAWVDHTFRAALVGGKKGKAVTKTLLHQAGIYVDDPVVIDEAKHASGYTMSSNHEIVFVMPDAPRSAPNGLSQDELLETARIKMAYTPCGI